MLTLHLAIAAITSASSFISSLDFPPLLPRCSVHSLRKKTPENPTTHLLSLEAFRRGVDSTFHDQDASSSKSLKSNAW
ncbi:hypothetical protein HJC23_012490 [Cyclotella cryptica]|uniref:Secreted protein n=1 Tax=Cyclotella cryptica TaxID=29204 RepID=A0ABD3PA39_9STRA